MKHNLFSLEGKVALVTGGNRGIGKTVAEYLADAGAQLVILDLEDATDTAAAIAAEFGVRAAAYRCDVSDKAAVDAAVRQAATDFGTLDILFNNAGIGPHRAALDLPAAEWKQVLAVNLDGVFFVAQSFAGLLVEQGKGGSIINTASMSGLIVNVPQKQAAYNASKAAVIHLTKTLAVEWAAQGIRVNAISPGYIATDLIKDVDPALRDEWLRLIPFGRMGTPEELAGAVLYLASDAAGYTSGSNLVIDGCYTVV